MSHSSRLDELRRILLFGMRDPHAVQQGPDYRDAEGNSPTEPRRASTPPPEARTDPDRGTGELGEENADPGRPLPP